MVLASICPQVYGLYAVKLAVCLSMIGGLQRLDESGTQVRGEIHLLLVGDPGKAHAPPIATPLSFILHVYYRISQTKNVNNFPYIIILV